MRDEATKVVETIAGERCPCGHLKQRHCKPSDDWMAGIVQTMGECRDCECRGLLHMEDEAVA